MPQYDQETKKVGISWTDMKKEKMGRLARLIVWVLEKLRLIDVQRKKKEILINNLTLLNFILRITGPLPESRLTIIALSIQIFFSLCAFFIRYPLLHFIDSLELSP